MNWKCSYFATTQVTKWVELDETRHRGNWAWGQATAETGFTLGEANASSASCPRRDWKRRGRLARLLGTECRKYPQRGGRVVQHHSCDFYVQRFSRCSSHNEVQSFSEAQTGIFISSSESHKRPTAVFSNTLLILKASPVKPCYCRVFSVYLRF